MNPDEIGKAYDQITKLWESKDFNRGNGIEQHKRAITFVENRGKALDVGCGCTGRFIDLLLEEKFTPEGMDVSEKMISLARQRHPEIVFHHKDICTADIPETYDFITAWDSIWHVPIDSQENVLKKLIASLNSQGVLIFSCGGLENKAQHTDDYMGQTVYYSTLGINGFLSLFIKLGVLCRHLEFDQYPESHAFFIVQKL